MELPGSEAAGVYAIENTLTGKRYVGSTSRSLRHRAKGHRECLNGNRHPNVHLQRAWNKYGGAAFAFRVIEECQPEESLALEQKWMDAYDAYRTGYNRCPVAGSRRGVKVSESTKAKIAAVKRGRKLSIETRAKMSETRKRIPQPMHNPEFVAKMKANHWSKGPQALEIAARIRAANTGVVMSAERRARISEARRRRNAERRAALVRG